MRPKRIIIVLLLLLCFSAKHIFASVVINEILPHPSSGSDWIELYNTEATSSSIQNWTLNDATGIVKNLEDEVSASAYFVVSIANRLNNDGDIVILKNGAGETVDSYSYDHDPGVDISLGKISEGGNTWGICSPTLNSQNSCEVLIATPTETISPTNLPTPTKTITPTKTLTPTKSPTPTKVPPPSPTTKPTATPTVTNSPTLTPVKSIIAIEDSVISQQDGIVLGIDNETSSSSAIINTTNNHAERDLIPLSGMNNSQSPDKEQKAKSLQLTAILIAISLVFLALAIYLFYTRRQ